MITESVKAAVGSGAILLALYVGWVMVRAEFWGWLCNALPDEEQQEAMKRDRPIVWRLFGWLLSPEEECLMGFGSVPLQPFDRSKVPPSTVEAVENLPLWDGISTATSYLRANKIGSDAFEWNLTPFLSVMELPEAGVVFVDRLIAAVVRPHLFNADTRFNAEGCFALYIWRKTWKERTRSALLRWLNG